MGTFHIHIKGRVQGVGFRPYVYELAHATAIEGWVCNSSDGVHIRFNASKEQAASFYQECLQRKPRLSVIADSSLKKVDPEHFTDFQIVESQNTYLELSLSPDFAMCNDCRKEMHQPADRRYQYSFITCTHCGPRYSILMGLPYDRPMTAMDTFLMCSTCTEEYNNPNHRRYYSQTNSCADCGIQLSLGGPNGQVFDDLSQPQMIDFVVDELKKDKTIAIKGIGGFLLLCNARSNTAINTLRARKQRPSKPFAVLYRDFSTVESCFHVNDSEKESLLSPVAPIVLLKAPSAIDLPLKLIAPELDRVGVMLPYAPLLDLISARFGGPLIATSANISGSPILFETDESQLFQLADFVLNNNRPITFPQDDSVVQFSSSSQYQIILRRSRGFAPGAFNLPLLKKNVLALGAEMKGTFALATDSNTYLSQYLGNLSQYENQVQFEKVLYDFTDLVQATPAEIAIDAHPGYFTHQLGKSLAEEKGIPVQEVQHHEAHFAAILSERQLLEEDCVLGVVWDGTGFGTDGNIWGGEFFDYTSGQISRKAHIDYFGHLANDRMAKDNRLCALSIADSHNRVLMENEFTAAEWKYYQKLSENPTMKTSSMGRVFDAIAFLSGVSQVNTYEGQSAMLLEQDAQKYFTKHDQINPYPITVDRSIISLQPAIDEIFEDRRKGYSGIGARFHLTLVEMIKEVAWQNGYHKIAFSGGVFQNGLLVDLLIERLGKVFKLYFHQELSPNDENIAYGQLAYLQCLKNQEKYNLKEIEQCV